jgi:ethanolamine utilization protein EutN
VRLCKVLGPMWASAKHPAYAGRKLLVVQPIDAAGEPAGASYIAVDHVQAGAGDTVVVMTEGTGIRQILKAGDQVPIRSLVVGIVDAVDAPSADAG